MGTTGYDQRRVKASGKTGLLALFLLALVCGNAPAQVYEKVYSFTNAAALGNSGIGPDGPLTLGSDGNFYGTTSAGGSSGDGTVFKMTPAGVVTTLVNFNGTNGESPGSGLIQGSDGNFYGTTSSSLSD